MSEAILRSDDIVTGLILVENSDSQAVPTIITTSSAYEIPSEEASALPKNLLNLPQLNDEKVVALASQIQSGQGDVSAARNVLVAGNMRLVASIAKRYQGLGLDLDDLIQSGSLGAMRAAEKFDPTIGTFANYATWWIKQSIQRAIAYEKGLSITRVEAVNKMRRVGQDLEQKYGREPSKRELAHALKVSVEKLAEIIEDSSYVIESIDDPVTFGSISDENKKTLEYFLLDKSPFGKNPVDQVIDLMQREAIVRALLELPEAYWRVVAERHGLLDGVPKTFAYIGREILKVEGVILPGNSRPENSEEPADTALKQRARVRYKSARSKLAANNPELLYFLDEHIE